MNYYTVEKISMLYGSSLKLYGLSLIVCMNCVPGILRLTIHTDIFKSIFVKTELPEDNGTLTKNTAYTQSILWDPTFFKKMFCGFINKIFPLSV